jgi:hypothetical protein
MSLKRISKAFGAYTLAGALALGTQEAYAQQRPTRSDTLGSGAISNYDSTLARKIRAERDSLGRSQQRQDTTRTRVDSTQQRNYGASRTNQDTLRSGYNFLNSRRDSPRRAIGGLFVPPFGYFCQTTRDAICPTITPKPTVVDSPRTRNARADSTRTGTDSTQQRNYVNSLGELTMAGSGRLMADYIQPLDYSSTTNLNGIFSTRGLQFSFVDAKHYLEAMARNIGSDSSLTGTERGFRNYVTNLSRHTPRSNPTTLRVLNQAARDGIISPLELRDNNGRLLVEQGYYMLIARKGGESVPILFHAENYAERTPITGIARQDSSRIARTRDSTTTERPRQPITNPTITARIQATRDSMARANLQREIAERRVRYDATARARRQSRLRHSFEAGLEAEFGENEELDFGAFANIRVIPGVRLEAFGNYTLPSQRGSYLTEQTTDTTERARELIGPGTYKFRTDETTTRAEERGVAEAGLGLTFIPFRFLDLFVREGAKVLEREETIEGRSTIGFERNSLPLGTPQIITNTRYNSSHITRPSFTAGARLNLSRRLAIEGSYNRVGSQNRGKAGLRFTF